MNRARGIRPAPAHRTSRVSPCRARTRDLVPMMRPCHPHPDKKVGPTRPIATHINVRGRDELASHDIVDGDRVLEGDEARGGRRSEGGARSGGTGQRRAEGASGASTGRAREGRKETGHVFLGREKERSGECVWGKGNKRLLRCLKISPRGRGRFQPPVSRRPDSTRADRASQPASQRRYPRPSARL